MATQAQINSLIGKWQALQSASDNARTAAEGVQSARTTFQSELATLAEEGVPRYYPLPGNRILILRSKTDYEVVRQEVLG